MGADAATPSVFAPDSKWWAVARNFYQFLRRTVPSRRHRRLRVCESLSLGDRRFLAVIEFDRQEFLVGGSGNSLLLLARLHDGALIAESGAPWKLPAGENQ